MADTPRHWFAASVSIPATTAVLLNTLMEAAGWREIDSHEGVQCIVKPSSETVYFGHNEDVRDAAGVDTYKGFPLDSGETVNLADYFAGGPVDPNEVWFYVTGGSDAGIIFKGI